MQLWLISVKRGFSPFSLVVQAQTEQQQLLFSVTIKHECFFMQPFHFIIGKVQPVT